jgi:4-hydroxy-tetrahydrodipicolinate synthase
MPRTIEGIVAYPVTPFAADGSLDLERLTALVERLVDSGVHAIAPLGSTGESAYLSDAEWDAVAEASVDAVRGRVPSIVGIAHLTTAGAVRRAQAAERYGAEAVMLLPVSYWKLSERELTAHFAAVAASVGLPIMIYNNPAAAGIDLSPEFLVGLTQQFENITMVKESSGDITRVTRIAQLTDGDLPIFNGSNPLALQSFAAGAVGWCTAAPCLIPGQCLALYQAVKARDRSRARTIFGSLLPLLEFMRRGGGLPTTVKAGLALQGFPAGDPRAPLLALDEPGRRELQSHLDRALGH